MLSDKEKKELLRDSRSADRKVDYFQSKVFESKSVYSLDDFISALMGIQKVAPFKPSRDKTIIGKNKL